jgi:hypothetical protein
MRNLFFVLLLSGCASADRLTVDPYALFGRVVRCSDGTDSQHCMLERNHKPYWEEE